MNKIFDLDFLDYFFLFVGFFGLSQIRKPFKFFFFPCSFAAFFLPPFFCRFLWMFERAGKKNSNNAKYQFWQQHNQPVEISNNTDKIDKALNYIHENPVTAGFTDRAEHYPYSNAVDYAGEKGMVKMEMIYG